MPANGITKQETVGLLHSKVERYNLQKYINIAERRHFEKRKKGREKRKRK